MLNELNVKEIKNTKGDTRKKNPVQNYVRFSFTITYILLLTTSLITFIEAMRTNMPHVRHILNLETTISLIAGYFYSIFITKIDKCSDEFTPVSWKDITEMRYVDWFITTPIMLIVLCIALGSNTNVSLQLPIILCIVILDYIMLYAGYLGEMGEMSRWSALIVGFIALFLMFVIIFFIFVKPKYVFANYALFGVYVFVWSLYGMFYMLNEEYKNIGMNMLDLTAKCLVGLGLWVYFTRIVR